MSDTKPEAAGGWKTEMLDHRKTDVAIGGSCTTVELSSTTLPPRGNGAPGKLRERATPNALTARGLHAIPPVPG